MSPRGEIRPERMFGAVALTALLVGTYIITVLVSSVALGMPAAGVSEDRLGVEQSAREIIVGATDSSRTPVTIDFIVTGPLPATIEVSFIDLFADIAGVKIDLPLGSTPYSLDGRATLSSTSFRYLPTAEGMKFHVIVTSSVSQLDALVFGGVKVLLKPDQPEGALATVPAASYSSIVTSLVMTPVGYSGGLPAAFSAQLNLDNLTVDSGCSDSWLNQVIPDIPGVIDCAPVVSTVQLTNAGVLPGMVSTSWSYVANGSEVATAVVPPRLLLPGQKIVDSSRFVNQLVDRPTHVNALPSFGEVKVSVVATYDLAGETQTHAAATATFFVAPWKELVAVLFCLVVLGASMESMRRWRRKRKKLLGRRPYLANLSQKALQHQIPEA